MINQINFSNDSMNGIFDSIDLSSLVTKAWDQNSDKIIDAAGKAGTNYIENNGDKLMNIGYGIADKFVGDSAAGEAKAAAIVKAAIDSGKTEAQGSITAMVKENKWIIIGGVVGAFALMGFMTYSVAAIAGKKAKG